MDEISDFPDLISEVSDFDEIYSLISTVTFPTGLTAPKKLYFLKSIR